MPSERDIDNYINEIEEKNQIYIEEELEYAKKCHNLEESLGCPLEVVFKALMNGAYLEIIGNKVSDNDMVYHKNISINSSEIMLQRTNDSCIVIHRKLADYKKTWWLKEEYENERYNNRRTNG